MFVINLAMLKIPMSITKKAKLFFDSFLDNTRQMYLIAQSCLDPVFNKNQNR